MGKIKRKKVVGQFTLDAPLTMKHLSSETRATGGAWHTDGRLFLLNLKAGRAATL